MCPAGVAGLLLGLQQGVELADAQPRESSRINLAAIARPVDQVDEPREVHLSFARSQVDAESCRVDLLAFEQARSPRSPATRPRVRSSYCVRGPPIVSLRPQAHARDRSP